MRIVVELGNRGGFFFWGDIFEGTEFYIMGIRECKWDCDVDSFLQRFFLLFSF